MRASTPTTVIARLSRCLIKQPKQAHQSTAHHARSDSIAPNHRLRIAVRLSVIDRTMLERGVPLEVVLRFKSEAHRHGYQLPAQRQDDQHGR